MKKSLGFLFVAASAATFFMFEMPRESVAEAEKAQLSGFDEVISKNAQRMMENGRQIFRFDTFGSEAFWGDALQLHRAIAGTKNGGVGGGVSPKTALLVGLKVDADALPD